MSDDKGFGPAGTGGGKTKECEHCRAQIDEQATRCPYCQGRTGKPGGGSKRAAAMVVSLVLASVAMGLSILPMLWRLHSDANKAEFETHRDAVKILDTKMVSDSYSVTVLGKVQNDSPIAWRSMLIEATFLNAKGEIIDTATETVYATIPPRTSVAFKAGTTTSSPDDQYKDFKVRIVTAEEGRF